MAAKAMDAWFLECGLFAMVWIVMHVSFVDSVEMSEGATQVVCDLEAFDASCRADQIIHAAHADFGHLHISDCAPYDNGQFGCKKDVTSIVDERCLGKQQCSFELPDAELLKTRPCGKGLPIFLEATYICLKGNAVSSLCRSIPVTRSPAYFTSLAALRSTCATNKRYQVILTTDPGQKIQLAINNPTAHYLNSSDNVNDLVTVREDDVAVSLNASQVEGDIKVHYTSTSNRLQVLLHGEGSSSNLIISFQATGCLDYRPPAGMWQERSGDNVTVGCYSTDRTWTLQCSGAKWVGTEGNCSVKTAAASTTTASSMVVRRNDYRPTPSLSRGVMLVTIIASTVLLCAVVITAACIYVRCLKSKHQTQTNSKPRVQYALSPQDAALLLGNGIQDGAQRNSWHNTMPLPQNNDQHGAARKDYMTMNMLPVS